MVSIVCLTRIPRLSRKCFDKCLAILDVAFGEIQIKPEAVEWWYLEFESYPDEVFERAVSDWTKTMYQFPNRNDLIGLCNHYFPERQFEIDTVKTLLERQKREQLIDKWRSEGRWLHE